MVVKFWYTLSLSPRIGNLYRLYSTSASSHLAKLRKRTGLAFTLCKKALEIHHNDLDKAELWLKEESIKYGYQRSVQIKDRKAAQGLIGLYVDPFCRRGALLELNCETDFVARNDKFRSLAANMVNDLITATQVKPIGISQKQKSLISRYPINSEHLEIFNDKISNAITHLGENIRLARALLVQNELERSDVFLFGQTHASGDFIPERDGVKFGKYGAIVALRRLSEFELKEVAEKKEKEKETKKKLDDSTEQNRDEPVKTSSNETKRELTDEEIDDRVDEEDYDFGEPEVVELNEEGVGRVLCQHIIGFNPLHLKKSEQVLAKEKELMEQGFKIPPETDCLLDQRIITDDSVTVSDFVINHGLDVIDFVRFECGEKTEN